MTEEIPVKDNPGGLEDTQPPKPGSPGARSVRPHHNGDQYMHAVISREQALRQLDAHLTLNRIIAESNRDISRLLSRVARLTSETVGEMLMVNDAMPKGARLGPWSRPAGA